MKNKDVEKRLRADIKESTPDVWARIEAQTGVREAAVAGGGKLKLFTAIGVPLALILMAAVLLLVYLLPKGPLPFSIDFGSGGFLYMDINPSVQFELDGSGKVVRAAALNDDARVLLAGREKQLAGKTGPEAAEQVMTWAVGTGYLSPARQNNAVLVSAQLEDGASAAAFDSAVKSALDEQFRDLGIYGVVITDRKDVDAGAQAALYGITESKMRLIWNAQALGVTFTEEEIPVISISEINERMRQRTELLENTLSPELEEEYERLQDELEETVESTVEKLETLVENIEDLVEDVEDLEALTEQLEEVIGQLTDAAEDGVDLKTHMKAVLDKLKELETAADGELRKQIKEVSAEIERELKSLEEIDRLMNEKKQRILDKQAARLAAYGQTLEEHVKPEDFDERYEDWKEAAEAAYSDDWAAKKAEWEREVDDD